MARKILWLVVSCLMALSLVIAACAPAATPATPTTPATPATPAAPKAPTTPVETPTQKEAVKPAAETPKYGGTLSIGLSGDAGSWAGTPGGGGFGTSWNIPFDHLWDADWAKGAAGGYGTKETNWAINHDRYDLYTGAVALSWDWTIDPQTDKVKLILPIRRGVHYHLIPGNEASRQVGGREVTADDVVWNLVNGIVQWSLPLSVSKIKDAKVTKSGPWEVTVEFTGSPVARLALAQFMGVTIRPPEVVKKWSDFDDWRLVIGTGAFMLAEQVVGSSYTYVKNPNWWTKDPIGPGKGNQLPYIDRIRQLVLPDLSTRYAAIRVAKIDDLQSIPPEDAAQVRKTQPLLKEVLFDRCCGANPIGMRIDMPPFNDIRVRHAMMMATDFNSINQSLYGGKATINAFPYQYSAVYKDFWIAHDDPELPPETRELYIYNPDKAKQLLKEAGYPNGFKVQILIPGPPSTAVDWVSILKDQWQKIGVTLDFMIRDAVVRDTLVIQQQHPPMAVVWATNPSGSRPSELSTGNRRSASVIPDGADPVLDKAYAEIGKLAITDYIAALKKVRELTRDYILYQAYGIPGPVPLYSVFFWPWVKNYSGEVVTLNGKYYRWAAFAWIDQDLKKTMGY